MLSTSLFRHIYIYGFLKLVNFLVWVVKIGRGLLFEFESTCIYTWVNLNLKLVCCMHRQLCLGCSLAGAWLYHLLLAEITFSFWIYNSFMSQKNIVYVTEIINFPLVSGIMLLCSASLYMPMLTLGSHRLDCSVLSLAIFLFMMKCEFSCQSLELIDHLA